MPAPVGLAEVSDPVSRPVSPAVADPVLDSASCAPGSLPSLPSAAASSTSLTARSGRQIRQIAKVLERLGIRERVHVLHRLDDIADRKLGELATTERVSCSFRKMSAG